jgi:hypothetical protein
LLPAAASALRRRLTWLRRGRPLALHLLECLHELLEQLFQGGQIDALLAGLPQQAL